MAITKMDDNANREARLTFQLSDTCRDPPTSVGRKCTKTVHPTMPHAPETSTTHFDKVTGAKPTTCAKKHNRRGGFDDSLISKLGQTNPRTLSYQIELSRL